jgi:hypothetical protein
MEHINHKSQMIKNIPEVSIDATLGWAIRQSHVLFLLTAFLLAGSTAATADPSLPDYTVGGGCTAGPDFVNPAPFCSQILSGGTDSLFYSLEPFVSLSVNASAVDDQVDNLAYSADLSLTYSFEVIGGNAGDIVPLLIATDLLSSSTGYADAYVSIAVTTSQVTESYEYCAVDPASVPCAASSFSGTIGAAATSGTVDQITLNVSAGAALGNNGITTYPGSASASADPFIYVDPSFAGAANYKILLSTGIGNAEESTPEPGTLILLGGCGPFAWFARRCLRRA